MREFKKEYPPINIGAGYICEKSFSRIIKRMRLKKLTQKA